MNTQPLPILRTVGRLLTFRLTRDEVLRLDNRHLIFGLVMTWIVGMGRSWDDPDAKILQHLGVGSVVYVFVLSLLMWLIFRPFTANTLAYRQVLTFVCLVSPPGLLYAIPVEMFTTPELSRSLNVSLLLIVASWRVALLVYFLAKILRLRPFEIIVTSLLPLATIMVPITLFQAAESIASSMGGLREGQQMSEPATIVLNYLGGISCLAFFPLLIAYFVIIYKDAKNRRFE